MPGLELGRVISLECCEHSAMSAATEYSAGS